MNTEDKTRMNQDINEMHSRENLWGSTDVVEFDGGKEEQGYEEEAHEEDDEESHGTLSAFRDGVLVEDWEDTGVGSNEFEEDVQENEEFLEGKEEEERSEAQEAERHLNQKNSDTVYQWMQLEPRKAGTQSESWARDSEKQEDNSKYTVGGEEDKGRTGSEVEWTSEHDDLTDDGEMTWYFTWK